LPFIITSLASAHNPAFEGIICALTSEGLMTMADTKTANDIGNKEVDFTKYSDQISG
jgi:hypothetical protein